MDHTICLFNDAFPPVIDGVANAVVNYGQEITALGGQALVVTPDVPGADDSGFSFPVLRYPSVDTRKQLGYVSGLPFSPELAGKLQTHKAELLHSHCPMISTYLARSFRDLINVPLVLTYHTKYDIDIARALRSHALQEGVLHLLVENISACDEVWVVSRGAGENLRSIGYEGEYTVMHNGVDFPKGRVSDAEISAVTGSYDLPAGLPVFIFVGRLMWYKGIRIILDALAALQAEGQSFRMVFVGGGGDEAEIRAQTEALGLAQVCIFTGPISDRQQLRAWYCRADLFLFPSTFDTNGLVVREAAACSLPSAMIAGSCAAEDVTDGRNGFLIEENAASLAACIRRLLDTPEQLRTVGRCAAEELYLSWADAVKIACDRYSLVIDNYKAGRYAYRRGFAEEFLRSQGNLMDTLWELDCFNNSIAQRISTERKELREDLRRLQADLQQHNATLHAGAQQHFQQQRREIRQQLDQFWNRLDRYL